MKEMTYKIKRELVLLLKTLIKYYLNILNIVGDGTIQRTTESEIEDIKTLDYSRIMYFMGGFEQNQMKE